jgi:predicted metal-dependent peptidase
VSARAKLHEGWFEALLAGTGFLERYPKFAGVLARMDPVATNVVPIMAVCRRRLDDPRSRLQLLVNVEYFERHARFRAGVLLHEIHHVLLGHLTDPKFHAVAYPRLMEIAMELSADEPIEEPLPPNGIDMERFARFGIRRGQSTLERYRLLARAFECGALRIQDCWSSQTRDTHRTCQQGAGGWGLGDILDARSDGATERNWGRVRRGPGRPTAEATIQRMKEMIAEHLRGERGGEDDPLRDGTQRRVAKELRRVIFEGPAGRRLDWPRVLREAFPRRRLVQPDYLRPNRRFPHRVGEIPGRRRRPPRPVLLVGVDTSGSMTGDALDRIAREIRTLARYARLTIVECDAAVHRIYPMAARLGPFTGGGDTDFVPVFDEAARDRRFEGLVYFTDGKGDLARLERGVPVLWAITHEDPFDAQWGTVVRVPE